MLFPATNTFKDLIGQPIKAEGTNQLALFDGTAPVGTLTNGVSIYSTAGRRTTRRRTNGCTIP